jgi:hypothetical protein
MAKYSEPFDNADYYSDDPVGLHQQPQKRKIPAIFGALLLLVGGSFFVQTTLASSISLNSGSNVEFGQGIVTTTTCDTSILVTPLSSFANVENAGEHKFAGVSLSTIDSNSGKCSGKDFVIKAYSNSGSLVNIFSNGGQSYNTLRVYDNAGNFYLVSAGSDLDVISGGSTADLSNTSFTVTFDTPIAAADGIKKITVESVAHVDTGIIYYGSSSYQLVSGAISWQAAYLDITTPVDGQCKYRRNGQCGYFAAITSDAERQAVVSSVGNSQMWLGGSDIQEEGIWRWIDGPQFGTLFSAGYQNWAGGEPNNSGNEDALQTYSGTDTRWNDLPVNNTLPGYLIEYSPDFRSRTNRLLPTYYDIGATGPGGGKIFYYSVAGFNCGSGFSATGSPTGGKCHFLEVALTTGGSAWTDVSRSWATGGNQSASVTGAGEAAIGSGYKNSLAIVAQTGNVAATSAAVAARAYRGPNNLSDWYLPSQNELLQLQANKAVAGLSGFSFWSSTENDATTAKDLGDNQSPGNGSKATVTPVRPIRAF